MAKIQTAFYFSSKNIAVTQGKTNKKQMQFDIKEALLIPVPVGSVINGIIMDEESLFKEFTKLKKSIKSCPNAVLVVDTTHIIYRLSVLPKVSGNEMQKLVRNEFINKDMTDKEYIYDYSVIKSGKLSKKQQLVLSCAIDKTIIDTYKAFFKRAGIKLTRIDYSVNAVLQSASEFGDIFSKGNTLICIVDHFIVSIINILTNGNIFFHRSRIISSETDANYFSEIFDVIYSYIQGRKSIDRNEKTENIYIYDSNIYEPDEYNRRLRTLEFSDIVIGIRSILFTPGVLAPEADKYIYNLSAGIASAKKNLNLLKYRKKRKIPKKKVVIGFAMTVPVALIALSGLYLANIYSDIDMMQQEVDSINMYLNSVGVKNSVKKYHELTDEAIDSTIELAPLINYSNLVSNTAIVKRDIVLQAIGVFKSKAVVKSITFESDSKSIVFDCEMEKPNDIAYYVWRLRCEGIFSYVSYMGYDNSGVDNAGWYGFKIACLLREVKPID